MSHDSDAITDGCWQWTHQKIDYSRYY